MSHVLEEATSGRAKCRGCGQKIAKGELRFGERQPNAFGDGEMTLWFHPLCAAYKRPEPFLETLDADTPDGHALRRAAEAGLEHPRLSRIDGAHRAPTGRARCRHCRELIAKDDWRIPLVWFEEFRFEPSGFVHATCATAYFGTTVPIERIVHFEAELEPGDLDELHKTLGSSLAG